MMTMPQSPGETQPSAADSVQPAGRGAPQGGTTGTDGFLGLAKRITAARSWRRDHVDPSLFSELGWEMLLALYVSDASGFRMTVSNLCAASNGPESTALRWIDRLIELGMARRSPNPVDARVIFVELEAPGREALDRYLAAVSKAFPTD